MTVKASLTENKEKMTLICKYNIETGFSCTNYQTASNNFVALKPLAGTETVGDQEEIIYPMYFYRKNVDDKVSQECSWLTIQ